MKIGRRGVVWLTVILVALPVLLLLLGLLYYGIGSVW